MLLAKWTCEIPLGAFMVLECPYARESNTVSYTVQNMIRITLIITLFEQVYLMDPEGHVPSRIQYET